MYFQWSVNGCTELKCVCSMCGKGLALTPRAIVTSGFIFWGRNGGKKGGCRTLGHWKGLVGGGEWNGYNDIISLNKTVNIIYHLQSITFFVLFSTLIVLYYLPMNLIFFFKSMMSKILIRLYWIRIHFADSYPDPIPEIFEQKNLKPFL